MRRRMRCEYLFDYEGRGEGDGWRMSEIQRGVWKRSTAWGTANSKALRFTTPSQKHTTDICAKAENMITALNSSKLKASKSTVHAQRGLHIRKII